MKVLAFAATNHEESINQQLVKSATDYLQLNSQDVEVELLDLNDFEMPLYSQKRENASGIPEQAQRFYKTIGDADIVLVSYAEHNGSYTAAFKNIFDWASRVDMKVYQNKPMVMLATSPGLGGARNVLNTAVTSAPYFAGEVEGTLSVPSFYENFDTELGQLRDADLKQQLHTLLDEVKSRQLIEAA